MPLGASPGPVAEMTSAGGDDIIRLRAGDTLVEGVTATAVGNASVSFRSGDSSITLDLYENSP
jgi:hypothetical protein